MANRKGNNPNILPESQLASIRLTAVQTALHCGKQPKDADKVVEDARKFVDFILSGK